MSSLYDSLTGESSRPERPAQKKAWGSRQERRESRPAAPAPAKNQRPAEVSEMVWGLAEQWLEQGTATFGSRPPVNLPEFSKRLSDRVNDRLHFSGTAPDEVNSLVSVMIRKFWDGLEVGDRNNGTLQFKFLRDEWDALVDQARTSLRISWLKENGTLVSPPEYAQKGQNALDKVRERQRLQAIIADSTEPPRPRTGSVQKPRKRNP